MPLRGHFRAKSFSPLPAHPRVVIFRLHPPPPATLKNSAPEESFNSFPPVKGFRCGWLGVWVGRPVLKMGRGSGLGPRCRLELRSQAKSLQTEGDQGRGAWRTTVVADAFHRTGGVDRAPPRPGWASVPLEPGTTRNCRARRGREQKGQDPGRRLPAARTRGREPRSPHGTPHRTPHRTPDDTPHQRRARRRARPHHPPPRAAAGRPRPRPARFPTRSRRNST